MSQCLICETAIEPFISFGKQPIANGFLTHDQFESEFFYTLQVGFCAKCLMVQLTELVDREKMFHENYAFFSSTSSRMKTHFKEFAGDIMTGPYLKDTKDPFVVEIGSNDGIMLEHFAARRIRHLGVEPSTNVAQVAIDKGINTISEFFDEALAKKIESQYGKADVIFAANVMCHIPYIHSVFAGIESLLTPAGVLMYEDPYIGDIVQKTSYDQIYDEHAFFFSVQSVNYLASMHGMEVIDALPQNVHGGSMRYVIAKKKAHKKSGRVKKQITWEKGIGLQKKETYDMFKKNVERSKKELMDMLTKLKKEGKKIAGYGATSKSTTVTNFCGITPDLVDYITDTTPIKIGKFSPGAHIPVKDYKHFTRAYPDYALLFAWNHKEEVFAKEEAFIAQGGKFILYVPEVHIYDSSAAHPMT